MEPTITIRPAEPRDLETIADFNIRLARETEALQLDPVRVRDGVSAVLDGRAEALYFVAERAGAVAGQLLLTREWSDWRNGWFFWIQSVYVAEPHRRSGLFRRLFDHARDYVAGRSDAVGLRLYVEEHNHGAQATYGRLGLETTGYRVLELALRSAPARIAPGGEDRLA